MALKKAPNFTYDVRDMSRRAAERVKDSLRGIQLTAEDAVDIINTVCITVRNPKDMEAVVNYAGNVFFGENIRSLLEKSDLEA